MISASLEDYSLLSSTRVVDAHAHVGLQWFEPVEALLHHMDALGIETAVLTLPVFASDDTYQRECVARYPDRFANVVTIPASTVRPAARLRELAVRR